MLLSQCRSTLRRFYPSSNYHVFMRNCDKNLHGCKVIKLLQGFSHSSSSSSSVSTSSGSNKAGGKLSPMTSSSTIVMTTTKKNDKHRSNNIAITNEISPPKSSPRLETIYVHPLSQKVLKYFQKECPNWIARKSLKQLTIHRDGSFLLSSNNNYNNNINNTNNNSTDDSSDINNSNKRHQSSMSITTTSASSSSSSSSPMHSSSCRVWTCYDAMERKYWLRFSQHQVQYAFLLQDHTQHHHHHQVVYIPTTEQVSRVVEELVQAVDELED